MVYVFELIVCTKRSDGTLLAYIMIVLLPIKCPYGTRERALWSLNSPDSYRDTERTSECPKDSFGDTKDDDSSNVAGNIKILHNQYLSTQIKQSCSKSLNVFPISARGLLKIFLFQPGFKKRVIKTDLLTCYVYQLFVFKRHFDPRNIGWCAEFIIPDRFSRWQLLHLIT